MCILAQTLILSSLPSISLKSHVEEPKRYVAQLGEGFVVVPLAFCWKAFSAQQDMGQGWLLVWAYPAEFGPGIQFAIFQYHH